MEGKKVLQSGSQQSVLKSILSLLHKNDKISVTGL